ncbi:ead/Ea22-like family protein, partial [Escherichia coli]
EPGGVIAECHVNCLIESDAQAYANAEFIAEANPATVLELLDELEAQSKRIAELETNLAALAAENAGLNKFIVQSCYVFDGEQDELSDAYICAIDGRMPQIPATDAFLADVRAGAFNDLCAAFVRHAKIAGLDDGDLVTVKEATDALLHCAEQLREGFKQ